MPLVIQLARRRVPPRPIHAAAVALRVILLALAVGAKPLTAQVAPVVERSVPFDSAGRVTILTPTLVARLGLSAPDWPVTEPFREARLLSVSNEQYVLSVQSADNATLRYALTASAAAALRQRVEEGLAAQVARGDRSGVTGSGMEVSEPAGNIFVRNQTILGLLGYGPATAALLSDAGGGTSAGGYFLAAGSSFFIAANLVKHRTVTRAQASLASHGGTRGGLAGSAVAAIASARGGPGYGGPILAGAIGGTVAGFLGARGLSDGEAGTSGLAADMAALTTLGVAGALDAFGEREVVREIDFGSGPVPITEVNRDLRSGGKIALGSAIGAGLLGYAIGPRYARRAAYNVTSGDAKVAFTGALIGAVSALSVFDNSAEEQAAFGVTTAGLLGGFFLADRLLVRAADRTGAEGTLVQLGAFAGALIGGGIAAGAESEGRVITLLVAGGGMLGLLAADAIVEPAPDAGPLRGIMQSSSRLVRPGTARGEAESRVTVSLAPLVTAFAFQPRGTARTVNGVPQLALSRQPVSRRIPVVRVAW